MLLWSLRVLLPGIHEIIYFQLLPASHSFATAGNILDLANLYTGCLPDTSPGGFVSPPGNKPGIFHWAGERVNDCTMEPLMTSYNEFVK